ncbi:hypothetical protein ACWEQL_22530, partial [Kitasatospora sp. NPDC004240]
MPVPPSGPAVVLRTTGAARRLQFHLLLAGLIAVMTAFSTAWQPAYERATALALARTVAHEGAGGAPVTVSTSLQPLPGEAATPASHGRPLPRLGTLRRDLDRLVAGLGTAAGPRLTAALGRPVVRVETVAAAASGEGVARPYGLAPDVQLLHAQDASDLVRYVEGRAPARPAGDGGADPVEVAVSEHNRRALGLELGRPFLLEAGPRLRTEAVLVGVFRPMSAGADLWRLHPMLEQARPRDTDRGRLLTATALVDLSGLELVEARSSAAFAVTVGYPAAVDPPGQTDATGGPAGLVRESEAFERDAVPAVCGERTLGSLPCRLDLRSTTAPQVTERLSTVAADFQRRADRTDVVRSFALAGLLAIAVAAVVAAARLTVHGEAGALGLQKARG